jgi:hypothetical protein
VLEAAWSPPIPMGSAATREWRRLDRRVRHELLRSGAPHHDPMIAAVAVGYARTIRSRRFGVRSLRMMFWCLVVVLVSVLPAALGRAAVPSWAIGCAFGVVIVGELVLQTRFLLWLIRMEQINAPTLLAAERPGPVAESASGPTAPVPGEIFTVRIDHRKVLRTYARAIAIVMAIVVPALLWGDPVFLIPALFLLVLIALMLGTGAVRWRRLRAAVVLMDAVGLELPAYQLTARWTEFTEIRIVPLRGERHPARVVVFVSADPAALLDRIADGRVRAARRATGVYGSPVAIPDSGLDRTGEEIATAGAALAGLPLRRLG